jgi:hypothetical protein
MPWNGPPVAELMHSFISLGDNCEFGTVQRLCGTEPLDLLRWMWTSPSSLLDALSNRFEGFGDIHNVDVQIDRNEYIIIDKKYNITGHTFININQINEDDLLRQQITRLKFLKTKLLDELSGGERIFLYKTEQKDDWNLYESMAKLIKSYGSSTLLCVSEAESDDLIGTSQQILDNMLVGWLDEFAPYDNIHSRISLDTWIKVCRNSFEKIIDTDVQR